MMDYYQQQTSAHGTDSDILDHSIEEETLQKLVLAIRQLSPPCRDVIYFRCFDRLPYTEIAALMDSTPPAERVRFYRTKKLLQDHMLAS